MFQLPEVELTRPDRRLRELTVSDMTDADLTRVVSAQDIYDIITLVGKERLEVVNIEDILKLDDYNDPYSGLTVPERVRHELRMRVYHISEVGISKGAVQVWRMIANVRYDMDQYEMELTRDQPGCSWKLIGFSVKRISNMVAAAIPYTGDSIGHNSLLDAVKRADPKTGKTRPSAVERTVDYEQQADWRAEVTLIYADVASGIVRDPNLQHYEKWDGPGVVYAQSRALRHMSDGMRERRKLIEKVLRELYKQPKLKAEEVNGVSLHPPGAVHLVEGVEISTEALKQKVWALRMGSEAEPPMNPQTISRKLNVPLKEVKAYIEEGKRALG
jgi:hypothetical protein